MEDIVKVTFYFYRSVFPFYDIRNISAGLIRLCTNSHYNHVSLDIEGYLIYQARAFYGVDKYKFHHEKPKESITIEVKNNDLLNDSVNFLESAIGKKYDYSCILGFVSAKHLQNKNKWFCSELANEVFNILTGYVDSNKRTLVSPKDLRNKILAFKTGIKYANS